MDPSGRASSFLSARPGPSHLQKSLAAGGLFLALLWGALGGVAQTALFFLGAGASATAGAAAYITLRIYFSPRHE